MKKNSYISLIVVLSLSFLSACADSENLKFQSKEVQESQTIVSSESQETESQNIQTVESVPSIGRAVNWNGVAWRGRNASVLLARINSSIDWTMPGYDDSEWAIGVAEKDYMAALRNNSLCLGVGADDGEMLVTWQGGGVDGFVEIVPVKEAEGEFTSVEEAEGEFAPVKETEGELFTGAAVYQAQIVYTNDWGTNTFRAVLTDLEPGQKYVYRVTDESTSEVYTFTAGDGGEVYSFIAHGDPQICDVGDLNCDEDDLDVVAVYEDIVNQAMDGQKPGLILSLGDQSDIAEEPELFLRYLSAKPLKEVPLAVVVGNHEDGSDVFSRFFYVPNVDVDSIDSSGDMSGDYWFYRNHTLFLCLNSNNKDLESHQRFLNEAREECLTRYGQPDWIIAAFHHSLFSAGTHAASESILERREAYVPMFEEVGVDVVFSGHDHSYTRSFPMDGLELLNDGDDGIVYFCLGSPTGTKYYDLCEEEMDYAAVTDGSHQPSVTRVDVTQNMMTVTTFIRDTEGSLNVLDSYEITK